MEQKNRVSWIDTSRGLAILGVIVFHTGFLPFITMTNPLLMSWMLPVFLFTGGWLLKDTPFTVSRALTLARNMFVPFCVAGLLSFLGWLVLRPLYPHNILNQPIRGELMKWFTGRNPYFDSPLWFIPTYLLASIIMQTVAHWWFRWRIVVRTICSLFFITAGFLLSCPFSYPIFSYDLVFLFIGMMMMGSVASTISIPKIFPRVFFDILALLLFVILSISNGYIDMFQRQFGNEFFFLLSAVLGTYSVARLPFQKFSGLGRSSMSLLIWHWPILQWLTYGLFATGLLGKSVAYFTKTSFVLNVTGYQLLMTQVVLCCFYTGVAIFCIFGIQKLKYRVRESDPC